MLLSQADTDASSRAPLVEVALALGFALAFALSPLSASGRPLISVSIGLVFGLFFLAYRWIARDARLGSPISAMTASAADAAHADRRTILVAGVLVLALFGPTLLELFPWYTESVWRNGHGLFVPLLVFAVARVAIHDHPDTPIEGTAWGLALLIPGLLLAIVDAGVHSIYFAVLAMPLVVAGLVGVILGPAWVRLLAVPILLLLFLTPIPSGIATLLGFDVASAITTQWFLQLLGRPVARDGVVLFLELSSAYGISPRCSGFSALYGAVALAVALGAVVGSWRRTLALSLCAVPLTILANGARVAILILVCEWRNIDPSRTMLHGMSGIAAYLGVAAAMLLLGGRAARSRLVAQ